MSLLTFGADRVIFDEAHHLRNKSSRVFKGAMRLVAAAEGEAPECMDCYRNSYSKQNIRFEVAVLHPRVSDV